MAIFHCTTKPIARSTGRSSVAAAAYRSGSELVDQRMGLIHDYTRRSGVVLAEIVMPDGATADRSQLWNAAEAAEKRKDSRTAREWVVALPAELDDSGRSELARDFARELVSRYGVAVDVAIHRPDREGDQRNHHAHLLMTTRQVRCGASGVELGAKTALELGDKDRAKAGIEGRSADDIAQLRECWANLTNRALERAGQSEQIDHRSLAAQGIDREATTHLGPVATDMERRGKASDRGDGNRQVVANNVERERISAQIIDLAAERERRRPGDKTPSRLPANPLPPWARNPHRMATVDDISAHGQRLFGPSKAPEQEAPTPVKVDEAPRAASSTERRPWNPSDEQSLEEQLREQEAPTPVEPVREAPPAAEKLTGSAAIWAMIPDYVPSDEPVLSFRERMAALQSKLADLVHPPAAAVPAVSEPVHQVQPAARQPSANELELKALKAGLVPVAELIAADPKVIAAKQELARVEAEVATAKDWVVEIPQKAAEWRAEHPWLATRHDMGWKVDELVHCAESLIKVQFTLENASSWLENCKEQLAKAERSASDTAYMERRPITTRIEALESVVAREQAAEGPRAPAPSQRRSTIVQRSDRDYRPHVDRDEPERGMD